MFEKKISQFMKFKERAEKQLKNAPEGILVISKSNGSTQFYQFFPGKKKIYLSKKNQGLIGALAQKQYNIELSKFLDEQLNLMLTFEEAKKPQSVQKVFDSLPEEIKEFVTPCEVSDTQFLKQWLSKPYSTNPYPIKSIYTTMNGEKVRSKSEALIADRLKAYGIPYKYECPLCIGGKTIYPDFTILNINTRQEVYFEHFGMMDNPVYVEKFLTRMDLYHENEIIDGINLFYTFEIEERPFDLSALNSLIEYIASIVK